MAAHFNAALMVAGCFVEVLADNGTMQRHHHPISLEQAAEEAPILSQLMQKTRLSQQCAQSIADLVPAPLRPSLAYGSVEEGEWCVLVQNNAAANKVRHLLPLWVSRLQQQGLGVQRIRLRLQGAPASAYTPYR